MSTTSITDARQFIKEAGFRLVQEYPCIVRVYEDSIGMTIREIHAETGECIETRTHDVIERLPRNRNQPAERIELLEILEKKDGLQSLCRYRQALDEQIQKEKARELRGQKQAIEQNHKTVEELRQKNVSAASEAKA